ncbi:aminoglycoside phosphotransferase family protein [Paenibacillus graminis]|uniref:phosphotransferase family protein n=1 Tax=Paenibacillus graminis TaxID=189425 RepID=UPI002DB9EC64|nr:aminoglycoside phosphotransferase family protein [Paenibacillus graminis]MEC0170124.1 aminoglycoside phosphotransferase family protein [Paenibacillus graminis]
MPGKQIGEGRTAEVREYGTGKILKLYRGDIPAHYVEHEYEVSKYVYQQGVQTPQPIELVTLEERKGIIFQQIHGGSMLRLIGEKPWRLGGYARQLASLHHDLHKLQGAEAFGRQKDILRSSIIAAPMLTMEEKTPVLEKLEQLPEGGRLLHGDFHPDNVLIDGQAWTIDWMTGMTGNPAGDAARSVIMFSMGALPPGTSLATRLVTGFIRQRLTKGYIGEYLRLSGRSYAEVNAWVLPVASARLTEGIPVAEKEQLVREIRRRLNSNSSRTGY